MARLQDACLNCTGKHIFTLFFFLSAPHHCTVQCFIILQNYHKCFSMSFSLPVLLTQDNIFIIDAKFDQARNVKLN